MTIELRAPPLTFKQALELDAHVRKGDHGSLVVFANTMTRRK